MLNMREYSKMVSGLGINIIYSGPMWEDGIRGIAEMVRNHLSHEELSNGVAKSIFSVFIEQITNVLMYSAGREHYTAQGKDGTDVPTGMVVLGLKGDTHFIQTGNVIMSGSAELIKHRIDHLNTLGKQELRELHKKKLTEGDDNPESKGAGLGLIEIARRSTPPLKYTLEQLDEDKVYFSLYVEINQGGRNNGI